jgi:glycosyltransferase involved in cell wall biosynthesis
MHVLFIHKNYPAQFGHLAHHLVAQHGFRCTFMSERPSGVTGGVRRLQYKIGGGASARTHFCSRSFENFTWHSHAVYETLRAHPEIVPDLVVGHSGFGSTLFLPDLYDCPIVNYFEWYYQASGNDGEFRSELPRHRLAPLRSQIRNTAFLADLQTCRLGYSPTSWQRSQMPTEYQSRLETIFDGIDTSLWSPREELRGTPLKIGDRTIPSGTQIVTYVSRGFESVRGFDIFMKVAKRICDRRKDVVFICVGSDRVAYGNDNDLIKEGTYREHILAQDDYDLDRFVFPGRVPPHDLSRLLAVSDLHIYLTIPFVLSWSMMNALACGCTVLASDTPPVREMIQHGHNGLLAPFYDVNGFVDQALNVLDDPKAYRGLGRAGAEMIQEHYSIEAVLPRMLQLYERALSGGTGNGTREPARENVLPSTQDNSRPWKGLEQEWPSSKPDLQRNRNCNWLRPEHHHMLKEALTEDTKCVLEVGVGAGLTNCAIADYASEAKIVVADQWFDTIDSDMRRQACRSLLDQFCVNSWDFRDRITILNASARSAIQMASAIGFRPQVLVIACNNLSGLAQDIATAMDLFPDAVVLGDNWYWPAIRRLLEPLIERDFMGLQVAGNLWRVWNESRLSQPEQRGRPHECHSSNDRVTAGIPSSDELIGAG